MGAKFRLASAVSGVVFVVLIVLSFIFGPGDPPGFKDSTETIAAYVTDNRTEFQAAMAFTIAASPFLLLFVAGLVRTLRPSEERGPAMLAAVAFAGGILIVALAMVGLGLQWTAAHAAGLPPELVRALWEAGIIAFVTMLGVGFVALAGATAGVVHAGGGLPRWLGVASGAVAIYTFAVAIIASFTETGAFAATDGALGEIAFTAFLVWVLLVSIVLYRGRDEGAVPAGT